MKNKNKYLKFYTTLFFVLAVLFGIWLLTKNIPYQGLYYIDTVAGKDLPVVSKIAPEVRVRINEDGSQSILKSPVYFDVRILPWYKRAKITLHYREIGKHKFEGVGRQTAPEFNYQLISPLLSERMNFGWRTATFDVDLNGFYHEKNVYRFLISTTQGGDGQVDINNLKIVLSR